MEAVAVIGLVAAALSIAKAVRTTVTVANLLFHAAESSPSFGDHMRGFAVAFRNFAGVVELAIAALQDNCKDNPNLAVIQSIAKSHLIEGLAEEAFLLKRRVESMKDEIPRMESRLTIITNFKWIMLKPDMEALLMPMTSLQTNIGLTVNVVNLEIKLADFQNHRTAQLEKEIESLKKTIKEQVDMIRHLREDAQYTPPISPRSTNASETSTVDSQVTLCHLAHNMVELERVPTSSPVMFTFTKPKRKRQNRRSSESSSLRSTAPRHQRPRVDPIIAAEPVVQVVPIHRGSPRIDSVSPATVPTPADTDAQRVQPSASPPSTSAMVAGRESLALPRPPSSDVASSLRAERSIRASSPKPKRGRVIREDRSVPKIKGGIIEVPAPEHPLQRMRRMNHSIKDNPQTPESPTSEAGPSRISRESESPREGTDLHGTTMSVSIRTDSGTRWVEAYRDRQAKVNMISKELQKQLGLAIDEYKGQTVGQYGGKPWKCVGIATLEWVSTGVQCPCYVLEELERPFIVGRGFGPAWKEG